MPADLRVQRTRKLLTDAFTELIEERPFEEISVSALCNRAMIRRTTFYKHFADKDEFLTFYIHAIRDEFEQRIRSGANASSSETHELDMTRELIRFLSTHERLMDNAMNSLSFIALMDALGDTIGQDITAAIKADSAFEKQAKNDAELSGAFMAGGILRMVEYWWRSGRDPKKAEAIEELVSQAMTILR